MIILHSAQIKILQIAMVSLVFLACSQKNDGNQTETPQKPIPDVKTVGIVKKQWLNDLDGGAYFYPKIIEGSQKIFMTAENYQGIYYYDLNRKRIFQLNTEHLAGFGYQLGPAQDKIFYRAQVPSEMRVRQFMLFEQNLQDGTIRSLLQTPAPKLTPPLLVTEGMLVYKDSGKLNLLNLKIFL